jgi:TonB family protein
MQRILTSLFLLIAIITKSQEPISEDVKTQKSDEHLPEFPGGNTALAKFLQNNITYPQEEQKEGIQGTIYVSFVVEKNGFLSEIKCTKSVKGGKNLEREAIRVVKMMPVWSPGSLNNEPVRVQYSLPIAFTISEHMPEFPGGDKALLQFLHNNIIYPEAELEEGIQGTIYVSFVVEQNGSLSEIKCVKSVKGGKRLEREAIRVVKKMPDWIPGSFNNKPIRVQFSLPISFKMDGSGPGPLAGGTKKDMGTVFYNEGVNYLKSKEYDKALKDFEKAIELNPKDTDALYYCAVLQINAKDIEGACVHLNQLRELGKHEGDALSSKYCEQRGDAK